MIEDHILFFEELHKKVQKLREERKSFPYDLSNPKQLRAGMDVAHFTESLLIDCENLISALVRVKNG